jgi:3-hydroxymyristoyl/3-hydroxydecanoyl-(acyl carrier protein) dehydratase
VSLGSIRHPEVLKKHIFSKDKVEMLLKIPRNLAYFAGHFPGVAIVAGVVQLHWAIQFAAELFQTPKFIAQGNQIKFRKLMQPEDEICLVLEHLPEKRTIIYNYTAGEKTYSSGKYLYDCHP